MSRDKFDRYFIAHGAARHIKFRRLNTNERHAFFLGMLSIAGQAPVRGCLLVGNLPAEAEDIAQEADVSTKVAASAMQKLRDVGVLYHDEEHGCDRVHDFEDWNPEPKRDTTGADRQKRYREKLRADGITRPIPAATKKAVMERDRGACVACGSEDRIEFHHRTPLTQGGDHSAENIELRCFKCHRGDAGHAVTGDAPRDVTSRVTHGTEEEVEGNPLTPVTFSVDFEEWAQHYEATTGHKLPARTTKAFKSVADSYGARRAEGHTKPDMLAAVVGAHSDQYRREHGYDTAESILRPTKIGQLIAKGRLAGKRATPQNVHDLADLINRRPA